MCGRKFRTASWALPLRSPWSLLDHWWQPNPQSPSIPCVTMGLLLIDDECSIETLKTILSNPRILTITTYGSWFSPSTRSDRSCGRTSQDHPRPAPGQKQLVMTPKMATAIRAQKRLQSTQVLGTTNSSAFYSDDRVPFLLPRLLGCCSCCLRLHSSLDLLHSCLCDVEVLESPQHPSCGSASFASI